MGDFLVIFLSLIFFTTPKEIETIQIWPEAAHTNSRVRELNLTFQRTGDGWCPIESRTNKTECIKLANGNWVDEHGKVLLEIKNNLKISAGTNFIFKPKDWENPLEFTVRKGKDQQVFEIKENGRTVREIKVKWLKTGK